MDFFLGPQVFTFYYYPFFGDVSMRRVRAARGLQTCGELLVE
jgi:hypothetical protein